MSRTKAQSMRDLRAARKKAGLKEFRAWVGPLMFKYLTERVQEFLCEGCGREEAECSADPCPAVQHDREEKQTVRIVVQ